MPKRIKKTDGAQPVGVVDAYSKPTPPVRVVHGGSPIVVDSQPALDRVTAAGVEFIAHEASPNVAEPAACLICGTTRTTDVCPVDGFRFTMETA